MTTETRPWLQDEGADPSVRELLESTEFDGPSDRQLEKLTARVAFLFDLPPGGGDGGGGGGPSAPAAPAGGATVAATSGVVKAIVAAGVISVGAVVATVTLRDPVVPPVPVVTAPVIAPAAVEPQQPEPVAPPPIVEPAKAPPPPVVRPTVVRAAPPAPPPETKPAPPPPSPDAELTALDDAIAAARAGRAAEALRAVEAHVTNWPDSPLAQEREVIAIEALLSLGRRDDARARLAAFRSKWPTSTHLVRLESMLPQ